MEGNIDKVCGRENITEEQILDLCAEQVGKGRVIVIEGAPGIGKSTLAWELCRKWEEYASMEAYSLVILLRLREKRVQNISDIPSFFYAYSRADRTSLVEDIINNQGRGVLFVLDGFDELPKSLQREGVLVDLLQKSILPVSTVVVTSRPSAIDRLLTISMPLIEKRIEILGFSQKSIEAYASNVFGDELEGFKHYISAPINPAINSLMYVPLYAAFVVIIYQSTTSKGSLPRTITQLYTQLCLTILNRYLEANTEYPSVRTIQHLPGALREQFLELSKLAYEWFDKEEVILYGDIGEHFGFLDAVPDLYGGREVSFNFLHLTLQEFFTAYHISQMSDSGVELFKSKGRDKRWNVVWRFVAGLTEFKFLRGSCFTYCNSKTSMFFIQCLFEAHYVKVDFWSDFRERSLSCSTSDYTDLDHHALGYCISNCATPESAWKVELLNKDMATALETFTQGLLTNKVSAGVITQLHIMSLTSGSYVKLLHKCMNTVATSPLCSITDLKISLAELSSNEERIHLFELISRMPHLQKLYIPYSDLCNAPGSPYCACRDTDGLLKFLQYLPHSKVTSLNIMCTGLEYFLMEQSPLVEDYCAAIQALISPPSNLRELEIGARDDSCHEGNLTMISLVSAPSLLTKLSLCLSQDCYVLNAFKTGNHLTELEIVYGESASLCPGKNWPALVPYAVRIIQHSTTLETLRMGVFSEQHKDALMSIATALKGNRTLRHLYIHLRSAVDSKSKQPLGDVSRVDSRISLISTKYKIDFFQ